MTPIEKAHFWQQQIHDCDASGLSGSAFCKQQSLIYHQFVYWRQKLTPGDDIPKQATAATGFARIISSAPRVGAGDVDGLTVSLPGGVVHILAHSDH